MSLIRQTKLERLHTGGILMTKHEKYLEFVKEYVQLCEKHGVMICSEGEELQIGDADDNLWGIRLINNGHWRKCSTNDDIEADHSEGHSEF